MNKTKKEIMVALQNAKQSALNNIKNDDKGLANTDTVSVYDEKDHPFLDACKEIGLTCIRDTPIHKDILPPIRIYPPDKSKIGLDRMRQIDAMAKSLHKDGFTAYLSASGRGDILKGSRWKFKGEESIENTEDE